MELYYTTTEAVRAAIGLTINELSDQQLVDLGLEDQLSVELDIVYPAHATAKTAAEAGGATAAQVRTWKVIKLFVQYQGACFVLPGLQNFSAQKFTDGGFEMQRFGKDDIDKTKAEVMGMRDKYKAILAEILDPTNTVTPLTPIMTVTPTFDPVTNVGAAV